MLVSEASARKGVQVRVLSDAPDTLDGFVSPTSVLVGGDGSLPWMQPV